ncbi:anti-phage defense-associated sirtuin Dsr2 [Advenella alkanexedens]|uniref:anti-phage defense-associated sirtuin Dsr2 n=1 Tax=Advenella alkanexedens TaxID=1481665 RepID=UPI0026753785|nr:anti-phage defense-associated sirtuin Dsr2 [Advenella alkanexedens]WKU20215.1 anti-phage defense-associated sirtuin Dsr2 [Advenella alkanexedens]
MNYNIPDSIRPYLNEIAERLWAQRAAVMVGAGFSKNAGNEFPDWNQLGDLFYQKAHGIKPDSSKQKYQNVLRIAEEVQAAIGRPALEHLLHSNIPDLNIEPSDLHVELLELPWVDVFTTNYDTLLERASAKVVTRRYEPVVNKEDIPYAAKPRIVKLHGSFPSERPFIITEEDYRRYPHNYAPFVNTVQQALLENTFCLIGFSGDDPNFLQWIGWIRDNLGKDNTQKIYLVGLFDLSTARMQLLAQRGIIVIDLSCCEGINKNDHSKALGQFFKYIQSKKPNVLDWPYQPSKLSPTSSADSIEETQKITDEWQLQRLTYPGWLILPHSNRENLWLFTQYWVNHPPDEKSPLGLDIQYIFELIWRLERCLLPIFNNIAEFCEKLIEKYWPFQSVNPSTNCLIHLNNEDYKDLSWNGIRQAWLSIAVAMLRFYREEGYIDKWIEAERRLKDLFYYLSAEQKEFLNYEGFLFSLFTLDLPNAKQRLENWRPNETQPYWMAKRAAALAEMGLLKEAETIANDALVKIRKKLNQKVGTADLTPVSLESNAMLLGQYIQDAAAFRKSESENPVETRAQFKDRWNELKGFKCDPWNEIKLFELALKSIPVQENNITKKREFDIGRVTQTIHFNHTNQDELSAYAFLRFCEEIGLPYRIGNHTMEKKTALASLQRISQHSPFWAIATLVRLGDAKAVDSLFNRETVYKFTVSEADKFISNYLDTLNKCRNGIHTGDAFQNDSYSVRLTQLLPEVISRLCCKCSKEAKHHILEFITEIYASPSKTHYQNIKNLVARLIRSMSEDEQYRLVPDLLKIPFPEDLTPRTKDEFVNPFLLFELNKKPENTPPLDIQPRLVDNLLQQATLDKSNHRRWAIISLTSLYNLQLLDHQQSQSLAEAIWRKTDLYDLPDDTDFYKFAFLDFPHPSNVEPIPLLKKYVKSTPFTIQKKDQGHGIGLTRGDIPIVHEIIGANDYDKNIWTAEDALEILNPLLEWWDADKDRLLDKENGPSLFLSIPDEFRARFTRMLELLTKVIGPKLSTNSSDEIKASLSRLLREARECGLPSLAAETACLHIYPDQRTDVYNRINEALTSDQNNIKGDALNAIAKIILDSNNAVENYIEPDPTQMLSQYLTWCPTQSISSALWIIVQILKISPSSFSNKLEGAIQKRLDKLLSNTAYDGDNSYLSFDEKLEIRRLSSILSATLWSYYSSNGVSIPDVIEKWRQSCLSSEEFSEIKNPWSTLPSPKSSLFITT